MVAALVVVVDQVTKVLVKTGMMLGQEFAVAGDWFYIHFTENPGMAFGMAFGGEWGKYALTLFRIVLVVVIILYLRSLSRRNDIPSGVFVAGGLILAGAVGNIIDCLFYGLIFSDSYGQVAQFLPVGGGYAPLMQGRVVDMLYFPLIDTHLPSWLPWGANRHVLFFRPVFNVADSAITCGFLYLILFQRRFLSDIGKEEGKVEVE